MSQTSLPSEPEVATAAAASSLTGRLRRSASGSRFLVVLVLLVGIFAYFSATQPTFLTVDNIDNLLTSVSILFLISIGLTFVMLSGGFDLSMGSQLALMGILMAKLVSAGVPVGFAIAITLAAGLLLGGGINGMLIGKAGLPFLVVTIGTLSLFRGVLNLWSEAKTIPVNSAVLEGIAFDKVAGVPIPVLVMVVVALVARFVLRSTFFGRDIYAVGGSGEAAALSGIRVSRTIVAVYAIAGLLAAAAGILQVARIGAGSPLVGETIIFDAAAAVLLGGTSFSGGSGGVTGTVVGVLFLGVLQNGLAVAGVESFWQQVLTGAIVIIAVALDRFQTQGFPALSRVPGFKRIRSKEESI